MVRGYYTGISAMALRKGFEMKTKNQMAFLDMLSFSEGTFGKGDKGYDVLVGGELFAGYADHPRKSIYLKSLNIYSTAAGRYQILKRNFDAYKKILGLLDFSPASQDAIALKMIEERGVFKYIESGQTAAAINGCANIWASLPGAGYGQRENRLDNLINFYLERVKS